MLVHAEKGDRYTLSLGVALLQVCSKICCCAAVWRQPSSRAAASSLQQLRSTCCGAFGDARVFAVNVFK